MHTRLQLKNVNLSFETHKNEQEESIKVSSENQQGKKKLHGPSPRANYTGRATAACRRSNCQLLRIKGCHVVSVADPYGRMLGFLDRSRYFSIK
jgi:hypothetical protein